MMIKHALTLAAAAALLACATGCSNTVRYVTKTHWLPPPATATREVASTTFYLTYWEGSCSSGFAGIGKGCSLGDSKIRRCNVKPDNSIACVDELEATKFFEREK